MFVGYKRKRKKRGLAPYVSINRRGEIVMNIPALELIKFLGVITLFYDAERNRLGIQGGICGDGSLHIFRTRPHGRGGRSRVVRAHRFLTQFGITITETLVFRDLKVERGTLLVLDLAGAAAESARFGCQRNSVSS